MRSLPQQTTTPISLERETFAAHLLLEVARTGMVGIGGMPVDVQNRLFSHQENRPFIAVWTDRLVLCAQLCGSRGVAPAAIGCKSI